MFEYFLFFKKVYIFPDLRPLPRPSHRARPLLLPLLLRPHHGPDVRVRVGLPLKAPKKGQGEEAAAATAATAATATTW